MRLCLLISTLLLAAASLSACASAPEEPRIAQTQSGWPEAVFDNMDAKTALDQIAEGCMKDGQIPERTASSVTCTMQPTFSEAMMAAANIGSKYSSNPIKKFRFDMIQRPDGSVYARCAITLSVTTPLGQEREMGLYDNRNFNAVEKVFFSHGGHLAK